MNNFIKKILPAVLVITILIFPQPANAQQKFGVGAYLGGGTIQGNLPSQGSFSGSLFIDFTIPFIKGLATRASFIYSSDVNILLPQNSNRYSPFLKGISLKEIYTSKLPANIFFEGGVGPLFLNDRTYGNLNEWDAGVAFSLLAGLDFFGENKSGILAGAGAEYGLTFTNTNVQYLSVYLQLKYQF